MAIEPIVLTQFGDFLRIDPDSEVEENSSLQTGIMWHGVGCCPLALQKISEVYSRLVCKHCGTIVVIPNTITTYQELRDWCERTQIFLQEDWVFPSHIRGDLGGD